METSTYAVTLRMIKTPPYFVNVLITQELGLYRSLTYTLPDYISFNYIPVTITLNASPTIAPALTLSNTTLYIKPTSLS